MKSELFKSAAVGFVAAIASSMSHAVPVTFFDTIAGGQSSFTSTVIGTGASVNTQNMSGLSGGTNWSFADFSIQTTSGAYKSINSPSANNSTGQMISINPSSSNYHLSGITFTFNSAVNAIGFEVGDWATCCTSPTPSSLYISFDGGSTQTVGSASSYNDNPTVAAGGGYGNDTIFVGAIDDTNTFTTVTFYGDGFGEVLTAGGTIYYSTVGIGSVNPVSEPAGLALLGLGLAGLGVVRRNKKA